MLKRLLKNKKPQIYFILDPTALEGEDLLSAARAAIKAGIKIIQYRDKCGSAKQILANAKKLRQLTRKQRVVFIINDRVDIALACGTDGVHLGQDDLPVAEARKILGPGKMIGLSAASLEQIKKGQKTSADYLGFGPLFKTPAKPGARPLGLKKLAAAVKYSKKPLVAIGGIDQKNIAQVIRTGVPMIAVRGVFRKNLSLSSALTALTKALN